MKFLNKMGIVAEVDVAQEKGTKILLRFSKKLETISTTASLLSKQLLAEEEEV